MVNTITGTNIVKMFEQTIFNDKKLIQNLCKGDLAGFETILLGVFQDFYNEIADYFLREISVSVAFCRELKKFAATLGLKKLTKRVTKIRLSTGYHVNFLTYYAEKAPDDYQSSRFVVHDYFHNIGNVSPIYASRVAQMSVITPSFAVGKAVLDNFNCESETEKNRQLSLKVGRKALSNRVQNMLLPEETLAEKRVLIGIDGGRTRTREWDEIEEGVVRSSHYNTFDTPWREPKLLVISTIDKDGKVNRKELPIYDVCFGDDELFELLANYLVSLEIEKAQSVQVVGDGAVWIWLRAKPMLLRLGVLEQNITESLDYYHAMEHLNDLEQYLPKEVQKPTMTILKEQLWKGDILQMKATLKTVLTDLEEKPLKPFDYFEKINIV